MDSSTPNTGKPNNGGGIARQTIHKDNQRIDQVLISFPSALPDADQLAKVEAICPGYAETIRKTYEENNNFAREEQREWRKVEVATFKEGRYIGLFVSLLFLGGSCWAIYNKMEIAACVLGGVPLIGLVGLFVNKAIPRNQK